jgi:glyoxylase-like metal-dependent hydrolase (beta-lactamase superfamily II)
MVLKDPAAWCSTPCTLKKPISFTRELSDGERFSWEEYDFEIFHAPGQTEFHSVIATRIDGAKVAFTGDNVFLAAAPGRRGTWSDDVYQTTVLRNSYQLAMHRKCVEVMDRVAPDLVCPGHRQVIEWNPVMGQKYRSFIERQERVVKDLVAEPHEQHVDLFWARLLPYLSVARPGERLTYTLLLRNNFGERRRYEARLVPPPGWKAGGREPARLDLEAGASGSVQLAITAPGGPSVRRALTAEILIDGVSQGPVAEALVTVAAPAP